MSNKPVNTDEWPDTYFIPYTKLMEELEAARITPGQVSAIRCASADLLGAWQSFYNGDRLSHDWAAHKLSIIELHEAFPDILDDLPEDL